MARTKGSEERLREYISNRIAVDSQIKSLEEEKKLLNEAIIEEMSKAGLEKVEVDNHTVSKYTGHRATIKKELLMVNGVDPSVIAASTEVTEFTAITIRRKV